ALLRRLVVIWRDRENPVCAERGQFTRQRNDLGGVVSSRTGQNLHAPLRDLNGDFNDAKMFFVRQRRALARGTAWHEKVDASVNLALNEGSQRCFVQRSIVSKWSDKCRACTCKHGAFPFFSP